MSELQRLEGDLEGVFTLAAEVNAGSEQIRGFLERCGGETPDVAGSPAEVEDRRLRELVERQRSLEERLAALVTGLESGARAFSDRIERLKQYTLRERFAGFFSAARMQRMQEERMQRAPLAKEFQELLFHADRLLGILKGQRTALTADHCACEASLVAIIEQHKAMLEAIDGAQFRLKQLVPKRRDLLKRLDTERDPQSREELAGEHEEVVSEYSRVTEKENRLLGEFRLRERHIGMFETFVDALNSQIAARNILINKLTIDAERWIALCMAQIEAVSDKATVDIEASSFRHISGLLERRARHMLAAHDDARRRQAADEAFTRWLNRENANVDATAATADKNAVLAAAGAPRKMPP